MRLAAYAGASTALAAGAILRAFSERPNFYSAAVYLAQSSACRMILVNFMLLSTGFLMYGLQRLLFGHLRPIEIEQLWDRGWYTITETALAMTTFRDEVGVWFFIMFVCLLAGKVWGWISQGRVEVLEQQPPANPRMFHARLVTSLALSVVFDIVFLQYCVQTLLDQPRPGMMVMFAFEFALLLISSTSTAARYGLSVQEILVVKKQTKERVEERRQEIRAARASSQGTENANLAAAAADAEVDENEIDVPGWQEKGRWVLFLDLVTDFLKLLVYIGFFFFLILFHGLPIHIIRDLYITTTSFARRIRDYVRYRNATRDMNRRYEDATAEDLARDGTCIVCREDMSPWQEPEVRAAAGQRHSQVDERHRPKKLPCGHILHLGCLRSWLERQQVCPTCRRSVMEPSNSRSNNRFPDPAAPAGADGRGGQNAHAHQQQEANNPNGVLNQRHAYAPNNNNQEARGGNNNVRARTFNFGSMRITFAAGNRQEVREALRDTPGVPPLEQLEAAAARATSRGAAASDASSVASLEHSINRIQHRVNRELQRFQHMREELHVVGQLTQELMRLQARSQELAGAAGTASSAANRHVNGATSVNPDANSTAGTSSSNMASTMQDIQRQSMLRMAQMNASQPQNQHSYPYFVRNTRGTVLSSGDPGLPAGVTIPDGWSLMPLHRLHAGDSSDAPTWDPSSFDLVAQETVIPSEAAEVTATTTGSAATDTTQEASQVPTSDSNTGAHEGSEARAALSSLQTDMPRTASHRAASTAAEVRAPSPNPSPSTNTPVRQMNRQSSNSSLNLPNWTSSIPIATSRRRSPTPEASRTNSAAGLRNSWSGTQSPTISERTSSEQNGHAGPRDKGKGRATTVEDDPDDNDDEQ